MRAVNAQVHRPRGRFGARVPEVGALVVLSGLIGAVRAAPQTESPPSSAVFFPERDRNLAPRLVALLQPGQREGWERGFALAQRLGSAGLPVLLDLAASEEADVRRRILLLAAAAIGSGPAADAPVAELGARAGAGSAGVQERFALGLTLALGADRATPLPVLEEILARRGLEPVEVASLLAACARFPCERPVPARWLQDEDPAVVAMAAWASAPRDPRVLQAWWGREPRHAGLVRRASLLGPAAVSASDSRDEWVRLALASRGDEARSLRRAAVLFVAEHEDPGVWLEHEGLAFIEDLVPILAVSPAWRQALWARGLLGPAPARLPVEERCRQAAALGLTVDLDGFREVAGSLARDQAVVPSFCLSLALRFCAAPPPEDVQAWLALLPDVRESEWVRLASGLPAASPGRPMTDARLDRVFLLAARSPERLPREVLAEEIEDALWRSGVHFGHVRRELELDLVRDALLAGSAHGAAVLGLGTDPRNRHLPRGLSEGSPVFEIGYEIYRAFREPGPRRPAGVRPLRPTAPR
jgi:hypothetical protein